MDFNSIITVVKFVIKSMLFGFVATSFVVVAIMLISSITVMLNQSALTDVLYIIDMWLPFNLTVLISWLISGSIIFLTYRLAVFSYRLIAEFIN